MRISYEAAYPRIEFLPSSRNWWAWLKGTPAECVHLKREAAWMATLLPDTLCRECLADVARGEWEAYRGRVVAFEPGADFTQYFFAATPDFEPVGLTPEVSQAVGARLSGLDGACSECGVPATWLWLSREEVASLDEVHRIRDAAGEPLCAAHGARTLLAAFEGIAEANVFYMNLPYGDAGAYVWI